MQIYFQINPKFTKLASFVTELIEHGVPSDAKLIYKARNCVYTVDRDGYVLNIKQFRAPKFPNCYIYGTLRKTKARRSYENAERLLDMGFGTPTPVAYIEQKTGGMVRTCYYVSVQLKAEDLRDWVAKPNVEPLLEALAREMVRLHCAGVYHKDFSPGNVLYSCEGGNYKFYLIDLNRMQFGVRNEGLLMRNFRSIYIESEAETVHLARLYAGAASVSAEAMEKEARKQFANYHKKKQFTRKLKKLFKW